MGSGFAGRREISELTDCRFQGAPNDMAGRLFRLVGIEVVAHKIGRVLKASTTGWKPSSLDLDSLKNEAHGGFGMRLDIDNAPSAQCGPSRLVVAGKIGSLKFVLPASLVVDSLAIR
jgi:hypothetical protein